MEGSTESILDLLPNELLGEILVWLHPYDLCMARSACVRLYAATKGAHFKKKYPRYTVWMRVRQNPNMMSVIIKADYVDFFRDMWKLQEKAFSQTQTSALVTLWDQNNSKDYYRKSINLAHRTVLGEYWRLANRNKSVQICTYVKNEINLRHLPI
uniref:F-box-like protein n=1 Tax=Pithovirus LCPAC304 TaxID=2506594 RepID=A0A481Z979_9VIRU|nr:MAG: F-box-like protein [Pithovirus LCPAC304]